MTMSRVFEAETLIKNGSGKVGINILRGVHLSETESFACRWLGHAIVSASATVSAGEKGYQSKGHSNRTQKPAASLLARTRFFHFSFRVLCGIVELRFRQPEGTNEEDNYSIDILYVNLKPRRV